MALKKSTRNVLENHVFFDGAEANTDGVALYVAPYQFITISIGADSGNGKINIMGSAVKDEPTWGSAVSKTNSWTNVSSVRIDTGAVVAGVTGYSIAGATGGFIAEINCNGLTWVNVRLSSYVGGTWTVRGTAFAAN